MRFLALNSLPMKIRLFTLIVFLTSFLPSQAAHFLFEKIKQVPPSEFISVPVFTIATNTNHERYLQNYCKTFSLLQSQPQVLSYLVNNRPPSIKVKIPIDGVWQELHLVLNEKIGTNTRFTTKNTEGEQEYTYTDGVFYHGIINNEKQSVVALSFFHNDVMGFLSNPKGNYTIGKSNLWQSIENEYIIYNEKDALFNMPFQCETRTNPFIKQVQESVPETALSKCVALYVECDYKVYTDFSSNLINATNYATSLLNNTISLYLNDSIQTVVNQLSIWTTADPYLPATNTGALLDSFASAMDNGFNGDIAHLMSRRSLGGGVAYLDILCINLPYYQTGISASLSTTVTPLPTYSWNSTVITHEIGHNLSSPHTHACAWNGNGTRIDNCAGNFNVIYQEGTCNSFPPNPTGGGTIMSYCHLQQEGINLSLGFGQQPSNLIRNTINAANCLDSCIGCESDITITGNYTVALTESGNWIKSSGQTRIDSLSAVILDANETAYILFQPIGANDYFLSAPQTNAAYFKAIAQDGCFGTAGKSAANNNLPEMEWFVNTFEVFPNPTTSHWQIKSSKKHTEPLSAMLYSIDGRLIWHGTCHYPFQIESNNIPKGIYWLQLKLNDVQEVVKVIKQ
jgi:hypothetical protein